LAGDEIADVRLATGAFAVGLHDLVQRMFAMLSGLEGSLKEFAAGKQTLGSDVLIRFSLTPVRENPPTVVDGKSSADAG
jgi:hypothetical protein